MLIDTHSHLDDTQFARDLHDVIARAQDAGVTTIIIAGTDVPSSEVVVELAERFDCIRAAVGIHPHGARGFTLSAFDQIRALASHPRVVGIGEIGLDFYYDDGAPHEIQHECFVAHLELAAELGKPVVIHDRDAHVELMTILAKVSEPSQGSPRGVLHCFSGDLAMAHQAIDLGYLISFAGNVTFKNAIRLQEIARALPLDKIVIETDAPYLSPLRGQRNEPANVARVAKKIAELKNLDIALVAQTTAQNSRMLFHL